MYFQAGHTGRRVCKRGKSGHIAETRGKVRGATCLCTSFLAMGDPALRRSIHQAAAPFRLAFMACRGGGVFAVLIVNDHVAAWPLHASLNARSEFIWRIERGHPLTLPNSRATRDISSTWIIIRVCYTI